MKESKNHISEMQRLAETGWQQMHETLMEHGLSSDDPDQAFHSNKKIEFLLIAACVFFILIFSYPYILNNNPEISLSANKNSLSFSVNEITRQPASENSNDPGESSSIAPTSSLQRRWVYQKINAAFAQYTRENTLKLFQNQKVRLLEKFNIEQKEKIIIPSCYGHIDTSVKFERTNFLLRKNPNTFSKKIQIFAGAGMNISPAKNYAGAFNSNSLNVHPEISIIIPVNKKLSIHTGLSAFSTVHGKEVSAKEKEIVNNFNSNVYYNINTTSIIKASYFDLPLTLHYALNEKWSIGSGLELAKLYKVNIKEEKQSYDYNNTLASATVSVYNSTPRAAAVFERKLEIKKFEPRFVIETNCHIKDFLISAGYHYGLGKTITLKDSYNSTHQYRNEYFKLGIQYRIK
ncbi:MAG TPA: outer membrane beta-barrel protein [Hanamia sp.]